MSIRLYIFILLIIFLTSSASVVLLYLYMNPIPNPKLALSLLGIGAFLAISSFISPILFFFKKIYYRGDVNLSTMNSSIRQGILLSGGAIFMGVLFLFKIQEWHLFATAMATILCIEVIFQALD